MRWSTFIFRKWYWPWNSNDWKQSSRVKVDETIDTSIRRLWLRLLCLNVNTGKIGENWVFFLNVIDIVPNTII